MGHIMPFDLRGASSAPILHPCGCLNGQSVQDKTMPTMALMVRFT